MRKSVKSVMKGIIGSRRGRVSLVCLALTTGCGGASSNDASWDGSGTASRHYANMPLVIDPNVRGSSPFHFAAHHIAKDDNMVALHMDWFPIPWPELAAGTSPPAAWVKEMDAIVALQDKLGLPVYLGLTPIAGSRDRLTSRATGTTALTEDYSFGARCEAIASRPDYDTVVRKGFKAYVEAMIARFRPRYLAISLEVNVYAASCPTAWGDMRSLLNETYSAVKAAHPELSVFNTYHVDALWEASEPTSACVGFKRDCLTRNMAPLLDLKTDLFAESSYPIGTFKNNGRKLPDDYLTVFSTFTSAPLAVAETGYNAVTFSAMVGTMCIPGLPSSPADQQMWMRRLLADADRAKMLFVTWWANEDIMPLADLDPCTCTSGSAWCKFLGTLDEPGRNGMRFFGTMGLRDFDGKPRPALADWTAAVAKARL